MINIISLFTFSRCEWTLGVMIGYNIRDNWKSYIILSDDFFWKVFWVFFFSNCEIIAYSCESCTLKQWPNQCVQLLLARNSALHTFFFNKSTFAIPTAPPQQINNTHLRLSVIAFDLFFFVLIWFGVPFLTGIVSILSRDFHLI